MSRFELDYNPISKWHLDREKVLPAEVQEKLDLIGCISTKKYQLQVIKRSRVKPKAGDVFVVEPVAGKYFYGRVLATDIDYFTDSEPFSVVIIFNIKTKNLSLSNFTPDYTRILNNPCFIHDMYWRRGLFYTVGNIPLTDEEKNLDYGFFKRFTLKPGGYFVDCYGNELEQQPTIVSSSGAETIYGVAMGLWQEFIIDSALLDNEYDFTPDGVVKKTDMTPMSSLENSETPTSSQPDEYVSCMETEDTVGVVLNVQDDTVIALGEKINALEELAYMNGYNWEALIQCYLKKHHADLLQDVDTDPEAGSYSAYYPYSEVNKSRAQQLLEVIAQLITEQDKTVEFVREHGEEIEWD